MTVTPLPARRRTGVPVRLAVAILLGAGVAGVGGGILLRDRGGTSDAAAAPRASLPAFHGQGTWRRGERPAPGFALHDQNGALVSLRSLRGKPVLLTFLDSRCTTRCPIEGRQLGSVLRRLPAAERPTIVVVSVDRAGDTPRGIRHALAKWQLAGPWTVHWLNAPSQAGLAAVWRSWCGCHSGTTTRSTAIVGSFLCASLSALTQARLIALR